MGHRAGEDYDDTRPIHDLAVALYFTFRVSVKIISHAWRDLSNTFLHYFRAIRAIAFQVATASGEFPGEVCKFAAAGRLGQSRAVRAIFFYPFTSTRSKIRRV